MTNDQELYTLKLLSLATIYLTKVSMLLFHIRITPRRDQHLAAYFLMGLMTVCAVASIAVEGASYSGHLPWMDIVVAQSNQVSLRI
jgi:hypothetical protein